ncbi:MAG: peptidylprolyl isomerase [Polyangiales bacterium]
MATPKPKIRDARFKNRPPSEKPAPKKQPDRPREPRRAVTPRSEHTVDASSTTPSIPWNTVIPGLLALGVIAGLWTLWKDRHPTAPAPTALSADAGATPTADGSAPSPAPPPEAPAAPAADVPAAGASADVPDQGLSGDPVNPEVENPPASSPDPRGGRFTLAQATEGLAGTGPLVAEIETSLGTFTCTLLSEEAPLTVANFVGLARGQRDFWDPVRGAWARRPFYDGSVFHRVIPGFMIQGGDILRSGRGGTGYEFVDENVNGHNAAGQLCMANRGPNTNGGQFFITEAPRAHLDGSYSIFGRCTPESLVGRIAGVPRNSADRPNQPVFIRHVRIRRGG